MTTTAPQRPRPPVAAVVAARRSRRARARRRRRLVLVWTLVAALVGSTAFVAGLLAAPINFSTTPVPPKSGLLLDAKGRLFATLRSPETLEDVPGNQIPRVMRLAIVAAEDERFFEHQGVDPFGVVRAAFRDLSGQHLQGGSTITQQYVKNVYVGSERTPLRKLREAALAVRLEQHLSKDEILTRYLNSLYLGNGTYGVQAASKFYFGLPIDQLDRDPATGQRSAALALARAATLAGIAPAPSLWNPLTDKKVARERELYTLNRMVANHFITGDQASQAYAHALPQISPHAVPDLPTIAPQFRDLVADELRRRYSDDELFRSGGLRVRTSLDLDLQKAAVQALGQVLPAPDDPWAVIAAVDPRTGDIRAIAQKTDRPYVKNGLSLATDIVRSSGSTIKPFTLARALMDGHGLDESVYGPPCVTTPFNVCNAENYEGGQFSLRTALEQSINTVYGPLAVKLGVRRVFQLAYDAGLRPRSTLLAKTLYPAQSIGIEVQPLSEASAFGTLVDHGVRHEPRTVLALRSDTQGSLYDAPTPEGTQVIPRTVADQVAEAMKGVVDNGTGTAARQPFPVMGKTGTTDNFTNAWFTGCSSEVCIAVWMGYEKEYMDSAGKLAPHEMRGVEGVDKVYGGTLPAEIFARVWDDYRALLAPKPAASPSAAPASVAPAPPPSQPVQPVPLVTATPAQRERTSAKPSPGPVQSAAPRPSATRAPIPIGPSPSRTAAPGPAPPG